MNKFNKLFKYWFFILILYLTGRLKKLDSIHRGDIRKYTGAFKTSPVGSLHVEANYPPPGTKKEGIGTKIPV